MSLTKTRKHFLPAVTLFSTIWAADSGVWNETNVWSFLQPCDSTSLNLWLQSTLVCSVKASLSRTETPQHSTYSKSLLNAETSLWQLQTPRLTVPPGGARGEDFERLVRLMRWNHSCSRPLPSVQLWWQILKKDKKKAMGKVIHVGIRQEEGKKMSKKVISCHSCSYPWRCFVPMEEHQPQSSQRIWVNHVVFCILSLSNEDKHSPLNFSWSNPEKCKHFKPGDILCAINSRNERKSSEALMMHNEQWRERGSCSLEKIIQMNDVFQPKCRESCEKKDGCNKWSCVSLTTWYVALGLKNSIYYKLYDLLFSWFLSNHNCYFAGN